LPCCHAAGYLSDFYQWSLSGGWELLNQQSSLENRARHGLSAFGGIIHLFGGVGMSGRCLQSFDIQTFDVVPKLMACLWQILGIDFAFKHNFLFVLSRVL
jgi:hypothetical protein